MAAATPVASTHAQVAGNGFAFGRPDASITFRGGFTQPTASGQLFKDSKDFLTLGNSSFAGATLGADVAIRVVERLSVQLGASFATKTANSHFRDFVDTDDREIEQTTRFRRVPLTAGLRYSLTSPGRALGSLAWVPAKLTPYVGAGGGIMLYRFQQSGDFVDFETMDVFRSTMTSSASAPMAYVSGGVDYTLHPNVGLVTDLRYDFARAPAREDFRLYDHIDVSGISATVGLSFRF